MSSIKINVNSQYSSFTPVPNEIIRSDTLTFNERMFLIWLLSHKETWQLNTKSISTHLGIGNTKVTTMSKGLQAKNYLVIDKLTTGHTQWQIFDCPKMCLAYKNNKKPNLENPDMGKPDMANQDVLRKLNNKNTKDIKKTFAKGNKFPLEKIVYDNDFQKISTELNIQNGEDRFNQFKNHHEQHSSGYTVKTKWLNLFKGYLLNNKSNATPMKLKTHEQLLETLRTSPNKSLSQFTKSEIQIFKQAVNDELITNQSDLKLLGIK